MNGRRGFFGQVFGGLAVALGFRTAPKRWEGMVGPARDGHTAYNYTLAEIRPDAVLWPKDWTQEERKQALYNHALDGLRSAIRR